MHNSRVLWLLGLSFKGHRVMVASPLPKVVHHKYVGQVHKVIRGQRQGLDKRTSMGGTIVEVSNDDTIYSHLKDSKT